jgi:hypothetical protein
VIWGGDDGWAVGLMPLDPADGFQPTERTLFDAGIRRLDDFCRDCGGLYSDVHLSGQPVHMATTYLLAAMALIGFEFITVIEVGFSAPRATPSQKLP